MTPDEYGKPLGPGYGIDGMWFKYWDIQGRINNCDISKIWPNDIKNIVGRHKNVTIVLKEAATFNEFATFVQRTYHGTGHNKIGEVCSRGFDDSDRNANNNPMSYSDVSARDPIFYRWHQHLEDLMMEYRHIHFERQVCFYT